METEPLSKDELKERATELIEAQLNELWDLGFTNEDLNILMSRIIIDINRGFVGEPC